jgi:hypothetical protein
VLRTAAGAVSGDDSRVVPGGGQMPPGGLGDLRVQVDGGDQFVAEAVGEQGRVVAGARADLQDRVAVPYLQLRQHLRHQGRLAAGRDQLAVAYAGGQRGVGVRAAQPALASARVGVLAPQSLVAVLGTDEVVRHEEVTRDALEGLPPARVTGPGPARLDLAHQRRPRRGGEVVQAVVDDVRAHTSTVRREAPRGERLNAPFREPFPVVLSLESSVLASETIERWLQFPGDNPRTPGRTEPGADQSDFL